MKTFVTATLIALGLAALTAAGSETCFGTGEKTDGMNKICFYSCLSGEAAITVSSVALCPLSIER